MKEKRIFHWVTIAFTIFLCMWGSNLRVFASENVIFTGQCCEKVFYEIYKEDVIQEDGTNRVINVLHIYGEGPMFGEGIAGLEEVDGKPWGPFTRLANEDNQKLAFQKVIIDEGITSILKQSFWGCKCIEEVYIPDSVEVMGDEAFYECVNLKQVHGMKGIKEIPVKAFMYATSLEHIFIPGNVESIQLSAFLGSGLRTVTLSEGLKYLPIQAFCLTPIESVYFPESVEQIGLRTFSKCANLKYVHLPSTIDKVDNSLFKFCSSLESVLLPEGIQEIDYLAFWDCESLKSLYVPESINEINTYAFEGCKNVTFYGKEGSYAEGFAKAQGIPFIVVPDFGYQYDQGLNKWFWYENGIRQGTYYDLNGVMGDGTIRGREIYDPETNEWYWLDACYDGAKACSKEVWMPYIYQQEKSWGEEEILRNAKASGDMADQVYAAIKSGRGKWVRYDANGAMYKGWYTVTGEDALLYPSQTGNTYYYDYQTGLMAKGHHTIDGIEYDFDENTGVLIK